MSVSEIPDPFRVRTLIREEKLDPGESEAIIIAEPLKPAAPLMDEQRGVRCARMRGLTVIRTPLIYADARILGLIGSVREKLDQLRIHGFRLADEHVPTHSSGSRRALKSPAYAAVTGTLAGPANRSAFRISLRPIPSCADKIDSG
jgi:hypothetical protein